MEAEELLALRAAYKSSKLSVIEFAKMHGEDREKMRYKLRKALHLERIDSGGDKIKFHKVSFSKSKSINSIMRITTSYGCVIEIPL